jgi:triosephosphate isomerase
LASGLTPIICVGETLQEREANRTGDVIRSQFHGSLAGLSADQLQSVVIAYEPVWAIGTGRTASPEQAEEVHRDLRKLVAETYNDATAAGLRILYGGSVKPNNARDLLSQADIDGALVGGASLVLDDFLAIARAAG